MGINNNSSIFTSKHMHMNKSRWQESGSSAPKGGEGYLKSSDEESQRLLK